MISVTLSATKNLGMAVFLMLLVSKPTFAATSSRLTIPLASNTTVVIETKNGTDSQTALISDGLDSTKVILSSDGTTNATPKYYPYGNSISQLSQNPNSRYYTGQRKVTDVDSPLYNYNARYYSPETGIFTQPDPVEGPNRFAYVSGNPILQNDPSGYGPNLPSSPEELEKWTLRGNNRFPYSLPMTDPEIHLAPLGNIMPENGVYQNRWDNFFSDPNLEYLASGYLRRSERRPNLEEHFKDNQALFVNLLMLDMAITTKYSDDWSKRAERIDTDGVFLYSLKRMIGTFTNLDEDAKIESEYVSMNLATRIQQDKGMCQDFAYLFSYTLAKAGIPSAVGGSRDIQHSFNLVNLNDIPYVVDVTGGLMMTVADYRRFWKDQGKNLNTWEFDTPWGNPFPNDVVLDGEINATEMYVATKSNAESIVDKK